MILFVQVAQAAIWTAVTTNQVFTVVVTGVNNPPEAVDDEDTTVEDFEVFVNVLDNDFDVDGNIVPGTVVVTLAPANGTATVNTGNGVIVYLPDPDFNGTDTFEYEVSDDGTPVQSSTALVTIQVSPLNDAPRTTDDFVTTPEDTPLDIDVMANDVDVDGNLRREELIITIEPDRGTLEVDSVTGIVTYTPDPDYNGQDTFEYRVFDDGSPLPALSSTGVATIDVTAVNDAPRLVDDAVTTDEDTPIAINVLSNDLDVDGNLVPGSVFVTSPPSAGTVEIDLATGFITYSPNLNYNGVDSFVYEVTDDGTPTPALTSSATVTITVNAINDPPNANPDFVNIDEDTSIVLDVLANDSDVDGELVIGSLLIASFAENGATTVDEATGLITYTPDANYIGSDSFRYRITDNGSPEPGESSETVVLITVTAVNDPPIAEPDLVSTDEDTPVTIDVLANDSDVDGNLIVASVAVENLPLNGEVTVDPDTGAITYVPNPNFNGEDSFTYAVSDDGSPAPGLSSAGVVTVTVNPINDPPIVVDDETSTLEDEPIVIDVLANDSDLDGDFVLATLEIVIPPENGTIEIDPETGLIVYTPNQDFDEVDTFFYSVSDDGTPLPGISGEAQVTIVLIPVNDAPFISPEIPDFVILANFAASIDLYRFQNDVDNESTELVWSVANVDTSLLDATVDVETKELIIVPVQNAEGSDLIELTLSDGQGVESQASQEVLITISADTDNDGMPDLWEIEHGLNPDEDDSLTDADGDGLSNLDEFTLGTSPVDADTDEDGQPDGWEFENGLDPLIDDSGLDFDADGLTNLEEFLVGSDPNDGSDPPSEVFVASEGSDETGNGSSETPWATIGMAMDTVTPFSTAAHPVTITAGAGTYEEEVIFSVNVSLIGAGAEDTTIQFFDETQDQHFVMTAADNTSVSGFTIALPGVFADVVVLLRIEDVSMDVGEVILDGGFNPFSIGVLISGVNSSDSSVHDSVVKRLNDGIWAVNSAVSVARNLFEDIRNDAVFVLPPEVKREKQTDADTPVLGDASQVETAGVNRFRNVNGFLVRNASPAEVTAQFNDWGVYTPEEIAQALSAEVNFEPFISSEIPTGSVVIQLLDAATGEEVPDNASPSVSIAELSLTAFRDEVSGLFVLQSVDAGAWTVNADAIGFAAQEITIEATGTELVTFTINLIPVQGEEGFGESVDGQGEGTSEGELVSDGSGEGETGNEGEGQSAGEGDTIIISCASTTLPRPNSNALPLGDWLVLSIPVALLMRRKGFVRL